MTDIHLPDGTGITVAEYAKGCHAIDGRPLPVIAISADRDPRVVEAVQGIGASWISKKSMLTDLIGQISRGLKKPSESKVDTGVISQQQLNSINNMIHHDAARQIVERSLNECADLIGMLKGARAEKRVQDWKELCHALHGHADLLGAVRIGSLLGMALREKDDAVLVSHWERYESDLAKEMQSVRAFYDQDLLSAEA